MQSYWQLPNQNVVLLFLQAVVVAKNGQSIRQERAEYEG